MTELDELLAVRGFESRSAQERLYAHLVDYQHPKGVIAQAGTGTGKSMAILAAAAHAARATGEQSIIVTPTLTLMNQYRDGDMPWAAKAFDDLEIAEVRGMAHYRCQASIDMMALVDIDHEGGCLGQDVGCSQRGWEGHDESCPDSCDDTHPPGWECEYREARWRSKSADIVVTNADMLIVNDRNLAGIGRNFLSLEGALFVDEAHTLERKLRDYASRRIHYTRLKSFKHAGDSAKNLARWIERQRRDSPIKRCTSFPVDDLRAIALARIPDPDGSALEKTEYLQQTKIQEAASRLWDYHQDPHDAAVFHVGDGSLALDWVNVSRSAGELLSSRRFGLVSATIPKTMASSLGVPGSPFIDVGHPFDYSEQAWIGFSPYSGDYRSAQHPENFAWRSSEVMRMIQRSKGGALLLFSAFTDLESVHSTLRYRIESLGLKIYRQEPDMEASERQALADQFKADGNAVLFGSESFATGFDVPGNALRLVVLWKLPYPPNDPVHEAIRESSFDRYNDMMKVRAVQGIGRLIRTSEDRGVVYVADNRGQRLLDPSDPLTAHLVEFAKLGPVTHVVG